MSYLSHIWHYRRDEWIARTAGPNSPESSLTIRNPEEVERNDAVHEKVSHRTLYVSDVGHKARALEMGIAISRAAPEWYSLAVATSFIPNWAKRHSVSSLLGDYPIRVWEV